jgi:hypothetical protein
MPTLRTGQTKPIAVVISVLFWKGGATAGFVFGLLAAHFS